MGGTHMLWKHMLGDKNISKLRLVCSHTCSSSYNSVCNCS